MNSRRQRIAVVGAGPIGLEAALFAVQSGYDVQVFERGRVAENVLDWGHVRLFSPFGMNSSAWGRAAVSGSGDGSSLPAEDDILTGREFVHRYLLPLSGLPQLKDRIHEDLTVCAIGKSRTWKRDSIGRPERSDDPFQLLLQDGDGERLVEAEIVLDCSGTYPHHNWLGAGGMPCIGEAQALSQADYRLPDIPGADRERFAGRTTLVAGSGYSAATAVVSLARLASETPETRIVWLTRTQRTPPIVRIENDPLPERDRLAEAANRVALAADGLVAWHPGRLIRRINRTSKAEGYIITVESMRAAERGRSSTSETLTVDRVIANVGYRPDRTLYEELQVHECYATQGPMKLAAALLGETSADCLAQSGHGPETLRHPEPGFFMLGAKSYGRDSRFLMRTGLQQIRDVFCMLGNSV